MIRHAWPLHRALVFAFLALGLLVALPVALFNALETRGILRTLTEERLRRRAELGAARIDDHLRGLERWAHEFERRQDTRRLLAASSPDWPGRVSWEDETLGFVQEAEDLSGILIARKDGVVLARTGATDVPADLGDWAPFREAAAGAVVVTPRGTGVASAQHVVLVPLQTAGVPPAVMGLADDIEVLRHIVEADARNFGAGAFGVLTDEHGIRLVDGSDPSLTGVPTVALDAARAAALERSRRLRPGAPPVPMPLTGERFGGAAARLTMAPWTYVVNVPTAWFEAPARGQLVRAALASLVALVLVSTGALLLARRLSQPFTELEAVLSRWRDGERGARAAVGPTREAARLGVAFNAMADEIASYERTLQDKVAERTAQLEAANRELELFTYSASHDLRSPLRAIDGFTSAVLEDETLTPEGREMLERTLATVERLARLIDKLLAFGRVSRHALARERVDLSALAREVVAELRRAEPERPVRIDIADGLAADADPALLRVVLDNLIGNAWKYTAGNDEARIEVGRTRDAVPTFFVRDNGVGFDMTRAEQLFTPFRRLHSASRFPGTGVGLATVQRILERHGGRIWAWSEPGRGATFYFTVDEGETS